MPHEPKPYQQGESMELVAGFEGGAIYTENRDGKFVLIINQVALVDMLNEEDRDGMEPIQEIVFPSEESRFNYIKSRGWA